MRRSASGLRSTTVTVAPRPALMIAACVPATPPPRIATSGGGTAGTPAGQHAAPAVHLFETVRANLWCHAAGNFGHGREERQRALWTRNCLISDGGDTRGHEIFGLRPIRREVEISEQDLPAAKLLALGRERLLDLYDHLRAGK